MAATTIGIAIPIPAPWGQVLDAARARSGDPAAGIPAHLTLLGPTVLADGERPLIEPHLSKMASRYRPFRLSLRGTDTFRPVTPVVFVAVAEGAATCARLAEDIRTGPLAVDLAYPYHPHVTIAHDVGDAALDEAARSLAGFAVVIEVASFTLYEHRAGRWFSQYEFELSGKS
jgi:2'-5' RNA ligase